MQEYAARLEALAQLWNRVERRVKELEQFRGEAFIPAINEMRYAGRRITDALALIILPNPTSEQREKIDEHLVLAKSYLINADHDITDAILFVVLRFIAAVIREHGTQKIIERCPSFKTAYPIVLTCKEIIQGSREDREKRVEDYLRIADEYLPEVTKIYYALLNDKELALRNPDEQIGKISARVDVAALFAMAGAGAGILALIFLYLGG
jgi:hypothetical protein